MPHCSFVWGEENVAFLKKRFEALTSHPLYYGMEYSDDKQKLKEWFPLVMEGRDPAEAVSATHMQTGTDVDYGALTRIYLDRLNEMEGFSIHYLSRVMNLIRDGGPWKVEVRDEKTGNY